jgi:predicted PurR-regulated permease PerM
MEQMGITFGNLIALISLLLVNVGMIYRAWSSTSSKLSEIANEQCAIKRFYDNELMNIKQRLEREQNRTEKSVDGLREDISRVYEKLDELKDLLIEKLK